jgi:acetyl-CoA C-acetyltransferase
MTAGTYVVICEPLRIPVGRVGGALAQLSAVELATLTLSELVRRTGLEQGNVDDVIPGNGHANGESPAVGRIAALDAGMSTGVRQGGIELRDRVDRARETAGGASHPVPRGMIETAENLRQAYEISRDEQDELAVRSHQGAVAAHESGKFTNELIPITVPRKRATPTPSSTVTGTPAPTSPWTVSARFGRSGSSSIPRRPSRRAPPRAKRRRRDVRRHHTGVLDAAQD